MRKPRFHPLTWLPLVLCACAAAAVPAAAAQGSEAVPHYDNTYRIFHLGLHAAEVLAWEQCPDKNRCRVTGSTSDEGTFLNVRADVQVHEKIARALAREDAAPRTQVFQILLLEAGPGASQAPPELPPGAAKALADLQGFLPYKSYRLLDSAWVRATEGVRARLVDGERGSFEVSLQFRRVGEAKSNQLFVYIFRLAEEHDSPALVDAKGIRRSPRTLLNTSFELAAGETIVVGTSRIDGADQALVVLLTAAPESGS